jgi:hypothetical protein
MSNRWAKLPEMHQSLIEEGMHVVRVMYPNKTEDEYRRAEGKLATWVTNKKRGDKRIWTLKIAQARMKRVEAL